MAVDKKKADDPDKNIDGALCDVPYSTTGVVSKDSSVKATKAIRESPTVFRNEGVLADKDYHQKTCMIEKIECSQEWHFCMAAGEMAVFWSQSFWLWDTNREIWSKIAQLYPSLSCSYNYICEDFTILETL